MPTNKTFKIKGMHCASCVAVIEKTLKKTEGVESASVNYGTESLKLVYDESKNNPEKLSELLEKFGYSLVLDEEKVGENKKKEKEKEEGEGEETKK